MNEMPIAFIIWCLVGCLFIGFGIYALFSSKAIGFWANAPCIKVTDIKRYNKAMAKLFSCYGLIFVLLGLPLLGEQQSPLILVSIIGVMVESISVMAVYTTVIEKKYRAK